MKMSRSDFPESFLFGVATSSYQIEGHAYGGAGRTQWDDFAATPGNVKFSENGAKACDHYHRMDEDLDLIENSGVDVYRFSTSWARILPEGRGTPNSEGIDFYDQLIDRLLERDIKPAVTLYHWELPSPLLDLGGWRNPDVASWFSDYTQVIMSRIGDRVWSAAPINEPLCVGWLSHFSGLHAPGVRDIRATARAMHHVLLAHGRAIQTMRGLGMSNLGAVCNFEWAAPADNTDESRLAADRHDAIYNRFFMGGLFRGEYPELVLEGLGPHLPTGWQEDFATITEPVDWCGVNYYTRKLISPADTAWPSYSESAGDLPQTTMGWEIYPKGLYNFLTQIASHYAGALPIYVTENGMSENDSVNADGIVDDTPRSEFLDSHLSQVRCAIAEGVPVNGYFIWSLMDNFEWSLGYDKRFGIVHVDFESLERTPKASYHQLAAALAR